MTDKELASKLGIEEEVFKYIWEHYYWDKPNSTIYFSKEDLEKYTENSKAFKEYKKFILSLIDQEDHISYVMYGMNLD